MNSTYFPPTAEEVEKIRSNDRETINAFFLKNYELIEETARGWLLRKEGRFTRSGVEELCNEAYLELKYLDFDCVGHFVVSLWDCFYCFHRGGREYFYNHRRYLPDGIASLDAPVKVSANNGGSEEGVSMVELLPARPQRTELKEKQYRYILQLARELISPQRFKVFRLRVTTDLTFEEIGRELGKTKGTVNNQDRDARLYLIAHYEYVLAFLLRHGSRSAEYYISCGIVPEKYEYAVKYFERVNERGRINLRRRRAEKKKRAESPEI